MSIFYTAYIQSDFLGQCIFLSLFLLSLICWVVLIYKLWQAMRIRRMAFEFQTIFEKNKERLLSFHLQEFPQLYATSNFNPFSKIFTSLKDKTIEILNKNHFFLSIHAQEPLRVHLSTADLESVESHVLNAISIQSKALRQHLFILSTITTLAPFLGLLGTVWGILMTFSALHQGGVAGSNALVLGGLATALATTVLGLVIAIPALVAYNYLKNLTSDFTSDMEHFLYSLLSQLELQYRKVDPL